MAAEPDPSHEGDRFPVEVTDYQYKGALQHSNNTWVVLYHCRPLNRDVIVKVKPIPDFLEDMDRYWNKVNPMLQLKQPNLLTPQHAFTAGSDLWLVYERHSGGSSQEILSTHFPQGIDEQPIVARILLDILDGLEYMHKHNLMHRNLRASNLHVDRETGVILLTEFGDLKEVDPDSESRRLEQTHSIVGKAVPYWLAPEIIMGDTIDPRQISKSDIYSFGITAMEIILGEPPSNYFKSTKLGLQLTVPSFASYERECPFGKTVQDMIESCLDATAMNRPSVKELKRKAKQFFSSACTRDVIATRLGLLSRTTEQRINHNLYPPRNITQQDPEKDPLMSPIASGDQVHLTFDDVDSDKLKELQQQMENQGHSNPTSVPHLDRADSDWDFSSTQISPGQIRALERGDDEDGDNAIDQRQESAGRFLIEQSSNPTRNSDSGRNSQRDSGQRVTVEGVDGSRASFSELRETRLHRANSDYSESDHPLSPSLKEEGDQSPNISPNADNSRQVGRFFVSREKSQRLSESQLSASDATRMGDEPSLSSSVEGGDERHTFDITDHERNIEAAGMAEGLFPRKLRTPAEEVSDVSDDDSGHIKSQVVGRFQVDDVDDMKKGHSPSVSDVAPSPTTDPVSPPGLPPHAETSEIGETAADIRSRLPDLEDEFYMRFPKWTEGDTATFIRSIGKAYESLVEHISDHAIDGDMFESLTDDDLQVMGIEKPLFRKRVITMRDRLLRYLAVRKEELNGRVRNGSLQQES